MAGAYWMTAGSPLGPLTLSGTEGALTGIAFGVIREGEERPSPVLEQAARELEKYFAGAMRAFTVPLSPEGTEFQKKVWEALRAIPYGTTASYGDIAARIGKSGAAMAVGHSRNHQGQRGDAGQHQNQRPSAEGFARCG